MCGRFVTIIPYEELKQIFDLGGCQTRPEPRYNVAPTQNVGVVRQADDTTNHYDQLKWGLVPSWSTAPSKGASLINARSETVAEKPSFRHAIKKNRCIIPVSGFYEWVRHESRMCDCPAEPSGRTCRPIGSANSLIELAILRFL